MTRPDLYMMNDLEKDIAEKYEAISLAKLAAQKSPRGIAWVVKWPAGHTTVETSPVLMKCNRTKITEVSSSGELKCA